MPAYSTPSLDSVCRLASTQQPSGDTDTSESEKPCTGELKLTTTGMGVSGVCAAAVDVSSTVGRTASYQTASVLEASEGLSAWSEAAPEASRSVMSCGVARLVASSSISYSLSPPAPVRLATVAPSTTKSASERPYMASLAVTVTSIG